MGWIRANFLTPVFFAFVLCVLPLFPKKRAAQQNEILKKLARQSGSQPAYLLAKRVFDAAFALSSLVILAPFLCVVALAIKCSMPGPVFYRQARFGLNGKVFYVLKFRTMHLEACDSTATMQTDVNDPRITSLGRILRQYNFDEYPQLLNILKGDMSLVGPRPHAVKMKVCGVSYTELVQFHDLRHSVKPGLTGLAQINGLHGPIINFDQAIRRHEYDLRYLQVMSFSLDLAIVIQTFFIHVLPLFRIAARVPSLDWPTGHFPGQH